MSTHVTPLLSLFGIFLLALVSGFSLLRVRRIRRLAREQRRLGIAINRRLRSLIADIQQHRGMVNAWLNGDAGFKSRIHQKQQAIDACLAELDRQQAPELMTPARWGRIRSRWQALRQDSLNAAVTDSFELHGELIRQVLFLMGDVAERSQFQLDGHSEPAVVEMVWTRIPAVAECIGQARAVGAGVAAAAHCSSVQRIKLRFLREKVLDIMADLASTDLSGTVLVAPRTQQCVHRFLDELEARILASERPLIGADAYFALATEALDAVFAIFDAASDRMERQTGTMPAVGRRPDIDVVGMAV
jgi:hypothetical protein